MGIPAERRAGLPDLPEQDTVIVLNTERFSLSKEKTTELLDWVAQGTPDYPRPGRSGNGRRGRTGNRSGYHRRA
ncbi:MAG: hypothetical protein R3E89_16145 [Thiolinea sp.]